MPLGHFMFGLTECRPFLYWGIKLWSNAKNVFFLKYLSGISQNFLMIKIPAEVFSKSWSFKYKTFKKCRSLCKYRTRNRNIFSVFITYLWENQSLNPSRVFSSVWKPWPSRDRCRTTSCTLVLRRGWFCRSSELDPDNFRTWNG